MTREFHDELPSGLRRANASGRRVALVIGNGSYSHAAPLKNPANDARAMAASLEALGFEVVGGERDGIDLDYGAMAARLRDFGRKLREGGEVATTLLFYAGHGLQVAGRNYLVPVDAALAYESDVGSELFELQHILNQMERPSRTSIVLLDACRNNPLARNLARAMGLGDSRTAGIVEGLAEQKIVAGTLIAYATQPEHVAYDGDGDNGYFTEALLAHIATPGREVELMLRDVRSQVVSATRTMREGSQVPWVHSSLIGAPFYFKPTAEAASAEPNPPSSLSGNTHTLHLAAQEWARLQSSSDLNRLKRFALHFPGYYGSLALHRVDELEHVAAERDRAERERQAAEDLSRRHDAEWQATEREGTVAAFERFLTAWTGSPQIETARQSIAALRDKERQAAEQRAREEQDRRERRIGVRVGSSGKDKLVAMKTGESVRDLDSGPELVLLPPGDFIMGEKGAQHKVRIGYPLLVGKFPVTFAEWDAAVAAGGVKHKPADHGWGRGRRPVINVQWDDAKAYTAWLSEATGKAYRLLSEAEWEYACRAGTTTAYSFGDKITKAQAQYSDGKSGLANGTVNVGAFPCNAFGLHDMHGNVWEWCEDCWHESYDGAPTDGSAWASGGGQARRVLRGGSWFNVPELISSANRFGSTSDLRLFLWGIGFRVARAVLR